MEKRARMLAGLWLADAKNRSLEKAAGCGCDRWSLTDERYALAVSNRASLLDEKEWFTLQVSVKKEVY